MRSARRVAASLRGRGSRSHSGQMSQCVLCASAFPLCHGNKGKGVFKHAPIFLPTGKQHGDPKISRHLEYSRHDPCPRLRLRVTSIIKSYERETDLDARRSVNVVLFIANIFLTLQIMMMHIQSTSPRNDMRSYLHRTTVRITN